jgi:hypothetical protein
MFVSLCTNITIFYIISYNKLHKHIFYIFSNYILINHLIPILPILLHSYFNKYLLKLRYLIFINFIKFNDFIPINVILLPSN